MKSLVATLLCVSAFSFSAHAAQTQPWYLGVGVMANNFNLHATDAERHLPFLDGNGNSLSQDEYHFDNRSTGVQAFGGYRFGPYIAAELSYMNFGEIGRTGHFGIPGIGHLDSDTKFKARGAGLSVLGIWPVSSSVDLFGQGGIMRWRIRAPYTITVNDNPYADDSGTDYGHNLFFGVGGTYHWDQYGVRLQYQRYTFDHPFDATKNANADVFSASFVYSF